MTRVLHGYWRSSAAYRVRIALAFKGLDFESRAVNLLGGEQRGDDYRALNPQGLVPLLVDGGHRIAQSLAIIEYLEEAYPGAPLLPGEPAARAHVRALALTVACDIHPLANLRVLRYLKAELSHDQDEIDDWARHWIAAGFVPLEAAAREADSLYLTGSDVTLADICLVPQMYNARRFGTDLSPFPRLVQIDARLRTLPAFAAAAPEAQADAPAT
jgi:maleylacetoacetate isomerase/maleylpyruvate isomerase